MSEQTYTEAWLEGPSTAFKFYTRTYAPKTAPRGVVVFIHGFIEHVGRYTWAHETWAARGFVVFTFDQRGFGRTSLVTPDGKGKSASVYGRTGDKEQIGDVEWALRHVKATHAGLPIFLMGHSMGGGIALSFVTRSSEPPSKELVSSLAGVIGSSPLLRLSDPPLGLVRWIGSRATALTPNLTIPAGVDPKWLTHDQAIVAENKVDPLIHQGASLRAVNDMLNRGETLLNEGYKNWPQPLPLLIIHGTEDHVTSSKASQAFIEKVQIADKKLSLYEGGYHELHNENNGVKEKFQDELITWAEAHLSSEQTAKL
ncbi:lysophospholipase [Auriscalpium vulgare]|uniref:Lysophospholipase n=1 Tax=Auriscalpium vulgare TaxID=40419 RepID=A0ACB8S302_9AGAM|nr:lysophospholipase [Auriscalpium vulgare]